MRGSKRGAWAACAALFGACLLGSVLAGASLSAGRAEAQYIPRHCGMSTPDYGAVTIGSVITLGRHTAWAGDTWWAAPMDPYVGRVARVTQFGGLDPVGCPYVRVDIDGGTYGWRIRDAALAGGGGMPGAMPGGAGAAGIPTWCGMSAPMYGSIGIGSVVVLGVHDEVSGDRWWNDSMWPFVGRTATVREFGGVDPVGCPYVRVDVDGAAWGWRIRNLTLVSAPIMAPPPAPVIPTYCGMSYPDYGPIRPGSVIVLGAHDAWNGDTWWNDAMWPFVGQRATVTELGGLDPVGCPYVRINLDGGSWGWRIRNATLVY